MNDMDWLDDGKPVFIASRVDEWSEAKVPPTSEWRICKCFASVTVHYTTRNGITRYQELCPACLRKKEGAGQDYGLKKAAQNYGTFRTAAALDRNWFFALPEGERVAIARQWIWKARYTEYLKSEGWKEKREAIFEKSNGECERCGAPAEHVHHLTYDRLGNEDEEDLEALCRPCHWKEHGRTF